MKLILNNPFRFAGVFANATALELDSQKSSILRNASIQRQSPSKLDLPFLAPINRTDSNLIGKAFSHIEQSNGKVSSALFWFVNGNTFDEIAFEYLYNGERGKAIEIWSKLVEGKEVTAKNYTCHNNYGTIKLLAETEKDISIGVESKINLIESPFFSDFVRLVADETYSVNTENQMQKFIDDILSELKDRFSSNEIIKIFKGSSINSRRYFTQRFSETPINNIETRIENTKKKRKEDNDDVYQLGLLLFVGCREDLKTLKGALGISDFRYKMLGDNLAKEVMNCAVDYFQKWKGEKDPSKESLKLLKYAETVALDNQTKDRITENIVGIEEFVQMYPVKSEIDFVKQKLAHFQNLADTVSNAKDFLEKCRPKLLAIKKVLGAGNTLYLNLSSAVVGNSQGMLVTAINELQETVVNNPFGQILALQSLKENVSVALDVSYFFSKMEKNNDLKNHCVQNLNALKSLAKNLGISTRNPEERLEYAISALEVDLRQIERTTFYKGELDTANKKMEKIKEWQLFRSVDTRNKEISNQKRAIERIKQRAEEQKAIKLKELKRQIDRKKLELKNLQK
jgi:hypothetical protein